MGVAVRMAVLDVLRAGTRRRNADLTVLFIGARLLDPASGFDAPGDLLVRDGLIADLGTRPRPARMAPR